LVRHFPLGVHHCCFRVQLALITYRDISGEENEVSRLAFLPRGRGRIG
jgi:hypothetical protein